MNSSAARIGVLGLKPYPAQVESARPRHFSGPTFEFEVISRKIALSAFCRKKHFCSVILIFMRTFSSPISEDIESVPNELQLEFIDLQCDSVVKYKFLENPTLIDFYSKYVTVYKYSRIRKHASFMSYIFDITFKCE